MQSSPLFYTLGLSATLALPEFPQVKLYAWIFIEEVNNTGLEWLRAGLTIQIEKILEKQDCWLLTVASLSAAVASPV